MSREWKVGDVVSLRCGTSEHHLALRIEGANGDGDWYCQHGGGTAVTNAYQMSGPLVVIDPDDSEQVSALVNAAVENGWIPSRGHGMQAALRSLIADPKPAEPLGLGAVIDDREGHWHVRSPRNDGRPWVGSDGKWRSFDQIDALSLVVEGFLP